MSQKNNYFLGWIALDVDGTITLETYTIPDPVVQYLRSCVEKGWRIAIVTGRPMSLALLPLKTFDFPHLVLAQNGTIAMEMPGKIHLFNQYFPASSLRKIEDAYEGTEGDFVVYSGYENRDIIYWRSKRCTSEQAKYIEMAGQLYGEKPVAIDSFDEIAPSSLPLVKCFGTLTEMQRVDNNLQKNGLFHTTLIRDPHIENQYLLLVTDAQASKGLSLKRAIARYGDPKTVIAAGDDENDKSLLDAADIKIAMAHAPESLTSMAHFIAPPTREFGIVTALEMALKHGK
ncbi:MAG: superfamily hydrolase/phosphatase [Parachlamydiales bacterium]|nr:superfamily hydrolase/phosphatase [Parachlamydiales bacterium]